MQKEKEIYIEREIERGDLMAVDRLQQKPNINHEQICNSAFQQSRISVGTSNSGEDYKPLPRTLLAYPSPERALTHMRYYPKVRGIRSAYANRIVVRNFAATFCEQYTRGLLRRRWSKLDVIISHFCFS